MGITSLIGSNDEGNSTGDGVKSSGDGDDGSPIKGQVKRKNTSP